MKFIFTKSIYHWLFKMAPSPGTFELDMEVQVQMFFLLFPFHQTSFVSVWMGEGNPDTEFIYKSDVPYSYHIILRLRSCLFWMRCFPAKTQTRLLHISLWFLVIFEVNDELICCLVSFWLIQITKMLWQYYQLSLYSDERAYFRGTRLSLIIFESSLINHSLHFQAP